MMADDFPIPVPDRLPVKIDPCPIAEAILEIRFVTSESWATLPGLSFARIRDRYPEQKTLPLAQLPEEMRRRESAFTYQPLIQFLGRGDFLIQFGPRVVSLVTKSKEYPGWPALEEEITWLVSELQRTGFVSEGERLGVRYINFFTFDIFEKLQLEVCAGKKRLAGELSVTSVLSHRPFTSRLLVANSAIVGTGEDARRGSVLDLDVWLGPTDFDLFENGLAKFDEAHRFEKQVFFGLLKPDFLTTLNPVYG
jgi:uncharacterized protein (TIGR04255 family)